MFVENIDLIWEKDIFPPQQNTDVSYFMDRDYIIARFRLNEADRLRLGDAKYIRLIAVYDGAGNCNGRVILAPPIIRGSAFRAITYDGVSVMGHTNKVTAVEVMEIGQNTLESSHSGIIKRLRSSRNSQRVLRVEWKDMDVPGVSAGVDGRLGELPLSDYREISFFVKGPQPVINGDVRFIIASGPDTISRPHMEAIIPVSALSSTEWRKVTIRYNGNNTGVRINGENIIGARVNYRPFVMSNEETAGRSSYIAILVTPNSAQPLGSGVIFIDEIILEEAISVYRVNAGAAVEYSRPGTLLYFNGIPMFADFTAYTAFESETNIPSSTESEFGDQRVSSSMVSRTGIGFSVFETVISSNLAFTTAHETFIWSADHSVSRTFGYFSVSETFFASPQAHTARHGLNLSYLSNFHVSFEADALYDFLKLRQLWNFGIGYRPENHLIPSLMLNTEAVWITDDFIESDENYGDIWVRSWEPMVPNIGSGAESRRTQTQIVITQRTRPVGAILVLDGRTNFIGLGGSTHSESSAYLDIPVIFTSTFVNFRIGRGFKKHLFYSGNNIHDDADKFFESINDFSPFWGIFPIYSLFADDVDRAMDKSLVNSPSADLAFYTSFNDHIGTNINLPPIYSLSAFILPSRIAFYLERRMEQKMDTRTDTLNLGGTLGFSAINMFGVMGYTPVFRFYQSDEFSHTIDAAISIPKEEDISWRIQSILGANFMGFTGGMLSLVNTFSYSSDRYWTESFLIAWETPSRNSIVGVIYNWFVSSVERQGDWINLSSVLNSSYEMLRRETLELTFDKSTDYLRWSITAGHEDIIRIIGRVNFTTFVKLRLTEDKQTDVMMFDVQLGTSLRILF